MCAKHFEFHSSFLCNAFQFKVLKSIVLVDCQKHASLWLLETMEYVLHVHSITEKRDSFFSMLI